MMAGHIHMPYNPDHAYGLSKCVHCGEYICSNRDDTAWVTEMDGTPLREHLAFYKTLSLKELRRRQDLIRQQQGILYTQAEKVNFRYESRREGAVKQLSATEELVRLAVEEVYLPA
jgi:hypothetical protein